MDAEEEDTPFRKTCRSRWAALIKKVYEVDPLKCPKCSGRMRIISFCRTLQNVHVFPAFQRKYPLFQLCFHFLSRLSMICYDPPSGVQGKSRIPSIFDLIFHPSLITVRTYENQNAYQCILLHYLFEFLIIPIYFTCKVRYIALMNNIK